MFTRNSLYCMSHQFANSFNYHYLLFMYVTGTYAEFVKAPTPRVSYVSHYNRCRLASNTKTILDIQLEQHHMPLL